MGRRVLEAVDGYEALELVAGAARAGKTFDFGVIDLNMPGMDGMELAEILKAHPDDSDDSAVPAELVGRAARSGRGSCAGLRRQPDQARPLHPNCSTA